MSGQDPQHPWQAPSTEDSRSPCPGLNALSNHGYLPRDGKNLTTLQLTKVVKHVYNLSWPLAFLLSLGGVLTCGSLRTLRVDLAQLALHNKIEHDASLVHDNVHTSQKYAPTSVDTTLLQDMLSESSDGNVLSLTDLGKIRGKRNKEALNGKPLDSVHGFLANAESALLNLSLGGQETNKDDVPCKWAKEFLGEERLPEGWNTPTQTISIPRAVSLASTIKKLTPNFK